ncbi:uroporphyrinogen-III synthase [Harpegnathos saltator]|uniref:Uroporphyrinogen-III synthase n=1 Tax=Harpegnathos saltator TaxID=610380 RepID=E2C3V9_HARSA|nr:uroporphyrinogen-III synthase [Harpegnathos saltator]EFN77345.1 Uroporphyrinogen-III synthase [Harpegnathos saltator]
MAGDGELVVLCRGVYEENDEQNAYVKALKAAGYTCEFLRTLRFEFVNKSELRKWLSMAHDYSGLILTSLRTVEAIALAVDEDTSILDHWKKLPAYCVGPATESLAQSQLGLQCCIGGQLGNSQELAEKIALDIKKDSKPLFYPCSEIARGTITDILRACNITMHKLVVYKTLECESLGEDLVKILKKYVDHPKMFVFFSPSIAEYFAAQLKKNFYSIMEIKAVAIGSVTRLAMYHYGFNLFAVAKKPEPAALVEAITIAKSVVDAREYVVAADYVRIK